MSLADCPVCGAPIEAIDLDDMDGEYTCLCGAELSWVVTVDVDVLSAENVILHDDDEAAAGG